MKILYLHGFASSPASHKGQRYHAHLTERGHVVERLDLRLPNRDQLRVSAMIAATIAAAGDDVVVLVGSSLGGLVAAHSAVALGERCVGAVLMCPAFRFAERWGASLGAEGLAKWRETPLEVEDHAGGPPLKLDFGFFEDATSVDAALPQMKVPTLVFHGRADETVPIAGSRAFAEQQPSHVTLVEVDDDHGLGASLPEMLPQTVAFLDRLESS